MQFHIWDNLRPNFIMSKLYTKGKKQNQKSWGQLAHADHKREQVTKSKLKGKENARQTRAWTLYIILEMKK